MISTAMCTRMMMIWSVSPWRQKLNSMALARGCVHSFLSGQPATEPSGGRSLIPWRWRVDVCILSCQDGPGTEPSGGTRVHSARSVPCVLAQNSGDCWVISADDAATGRSPCVSEFRRIVWARQGRNLNLQACCPQCSVYNHARRQALLRQVAKRAKAPWAQNRGVSQCVCVCALMVCTGRQA